jgi:hypothetical protein
MRWRTQICLAVVLCATIVSFPLVVSVDGFHFLNSAEALFSPDFAENYAWFREPGYPFFLKSLHSIFGSSDLVLTLVQGAALVTALIVTARAFKIGLFTTRKLQTSFLALGLVNPVFLGYSSMVFRQALFTCLLGILTYLVSIGLRRDGSGGVRALFWSLIVIGIGVSLSISFLFIGIVPLVILAARWAIGLRDRLGGKFQSRKLVALLGLVTFVVSIVWSSVFIWSQVSNEVKEGSKKAPEGVFSLWESVDGAFDLGLSQYAGQFVFMSRATLMLGPTDNVGGISENELWTRWQLDPENLCGSWDGIFGSDANRARSYITSSCRSFYGQRMMSALRKPGLTFYKVCSIAFILFPLYLIMRRRWAALVTLATPLWFLLLYAARDYSNDRYGIPLYPVGLVALGTMVQDVFDWVAGVSRQRIASRTRLLGFVLRKHSSNEAKPVAPMTKNDRD